MKHTQHHFKTPLHLCCLLSVLFVPAAHASNRTAEDEALYQAQKEAYEKQRKPYYGVEAYLGYATNYWAANRVQNAEVTTTGKSIYLIGLQNGTGKRFDFEALAWLPSHFGSRDEQERIMNSESEVYRSSFVKLAASMSYSLTDLWNDYASEKYRFDLKSPAGIDLYTKVTANSFLLDIDAKGEVIFVDRKGNESTLNAGDSLNRLTKFRSIEAGLAFTGISFGSRFGVENIDYSRPFNIKDINTIDPVLNEGHFNAYGISFMWDTTLSVSHQNSNSGPWFKLGGVWPLDASSANIDYAGNKTLGQDELGGYAAVGYFKTLVEIGCSYPMGNHVSISGSYNFTKLTFVQGYKNGDKYTFKNKDEYAIASERIHLVQLTLAVHI